MGNYYERISERHNVCKAGKGDGLSLYGFNIIWFNDMDYYYKLININTVIDFDDFCINNKSCIY